MTSKPEPGHQLVEYDRNQWQAKAGALMTIIEEAARKDPELSDMYRRACDAINTNWYTKNVQDTKLEEALKHTMRKTIETAVAAGWVIPASGGDFQLSLHRFGDDCTVYAHLDHGSRLLVGYARLPPDARDPEDA